MPVLREGRFTSLASRVDDAARTVERHGQEIDSLHLLFDGLRSESHEGAAIAIALGSMRIPRDRDRAVGVRLAHYRSGDAIAVSGAFRLPERTRAVVSLGIAYGFEYHQKRMNVRLAWRW